MIDSIIDKYGVKQKRGHTVVWVGGVDYWYQGLKKPIPSAKLTESEKKWIREKAELVSKELDLPPYYFNSVHINKYDINVGIMGHYDDEDIFVENSTIGILTLFGSAELTVGKKKIKTHPGHITGIKTTDWHIVGKAIDGARISLTFRKTKNKIKDNKDGQKSE
jgi:hypothetical protein